jgi:hypothetical protein
MAAFLKADKSGAVTVKITPEIPNSKTYQVKVNVGDK